jgi:hypothetical protein
MGFPEAVRTRALVASARHCCVCHRYKGLKVEVHHIEPEASGGSTDFENAIALCFDCHADVGHYNPKHPRGTKLSQSELKQQRDAWYETVKSGHVVMASESQLHSRYLICKDFEAIREIALGDLARLPVTQPHLAQTPAGAFLQGMVRRHPRNYRHEQEWGDSFAGISEYLNTHRDAELRGGPNSSRFPYFEALRQLSIEELRKRVAPLDAISELLLSADVPAENIACALAYTLACGAEERFQEIYRLRPWWSVYLAVTNMGSSLVNLDSLVYEFDASNEGVYRPLQAAQTHEIAQHPLPRAPLTSGATAVIPVASLLGPLSDDQFEAHWMEFTSMTTGRSQSLAHGGFSAMGSTVSVIGPTTWPHSIRLTIESSQIEQPVHSFDLRNVYVLSRHWECGSCPHLFLEGLDGELSYLGEVFAKLPGKSHDYVLATPSGAAALWLAELEEETTSLESLYINGRLSHEHLVMRKGDSLRVAVRQGDTCVFRGYYDSRTNRLTEPWTRNCIVGNFMKRINVASRY